MPEGSCAGAAQCNAPARGGWRCSCQRAPVRQAGRAMQAWSAEGCGWHRACSSACATHQSGSCAGSSPAVCPGRRPPGAAAPPTGRRTWVLPAAAPRPQEGHRRCRCCCRRRAAERRRRRWRRTAGGQTAGGAPRRDDGRPPRLESRTGSQKGAGKEPSCRAASCGRSGPLEKLKGGAQETEQRGSKPKCRMHVCLWHCR